MLSQATGHASTVESRPLALTGSWGVYLSWLENSVYTRGVGGSSPSTPTTALAVGAAGLHLNTAKISDTIGAWPIARAPITMVTSARL